MIHRHNSFPRARPCQPFTPLESIEVIEGGNNDWTKMLPFQGEVDREPIEIEGEELKKFPKTKPRRTLDVRHKQRIYIRKCLSRNINLYNKLSKALNWIGNRSIAKRQEITAKPPYNHTEHMTRPLDRVEETWTQSNFEESLSYPLASSVDQGKDYATKANIVSIQNAIISQASNFDIRSQCADQLIDCLEEYKSEVKKYTKRALKSDCKYKKFKHSIKMHKCHQKQLECSLRNYYCLGEDQGWKHFNDYFLILTPDIVSNLEEINKGLSAIPNFYFLNMHVVNRLSALLRALKYCSDKNINFDTFQAFIQNDSSTYLRALGKHKISKVYPIQTDFQYLLSFDRADVLNEINKLCTMLLEPTPEDPVACSQEEALEMEIEKTSKKVEELEEKMKARMNGKRMQKSREEDRGLMNSYEKYMVTRKKRKEETTLDNCCSTEYTDKLISNPIVNL